MRSNYHTGWLRAGTAEPTKQEYKEPGMNDETDHFMLNRDSVDGEELAAV